MLNPARRSGETENEESRKTLAEAGDRGARQQPGVRPDAPEVDGDRRRRSASSSRSTGSRATSPRRATTRSSRRKKHEVAEMVACFDADWARAGRSRRTRTRVSSGAPTTAASASRHSSTRRKQTLWLQNERYQDTVIIERLVRAARRGVKVHILARPPHTLKKEKLIEGVGGLRIMSDVGAKVHTLKDLKLHAKMLLADGERADRRLDQPGARQLRRAARARASKSTSHHVVARLSKIAQHDWEHSSPLDLTDEGLLRRSREARRGGRRQARARPQARHGQGEKALTAARAAYGRFAAIGRAGWPASASARSRRSSHALPLPMPFASASSLRERAKKQRERRRRARAARRVPSPPVARPRRARCARAAATGVPVAAPRRSPQARARPRRVATAAAAGLRLRLRAREDPQRARGVAREPCLGELEARRSARRR